MRADLDKRYYDGVRDLCASVGGDAAPAGSLADLKKQAASPVAVDARLPATTPPAKAAALYEPAVDAFWDGAPTTSTSSSPACR